MAFVSVRQSRLFYEIHGAGAPVLLLHGVGGNHASWFNQIATWTERFCLIAMDARGFGNSTDVERLGRSGFVDDIETVLDTLRVPKTIVVGQSMGGGAALAFTCRYPTRVRALILTDTLVGFTHCTENVALLKAAAEHNKDKSQAERVLGETTRREWPIAAILYTQIASFNSYTLKTLKGRQQVHSPEDLAATGVPTLFVVGEEDVLFPAAAVRAIHARVPGSRMVEIAGAGHSAYFEFPAAFDQAVMTWLLDIGAEQF